MDYTETSHGYQSAYPLSLPAIGHPARAAAISFLMQAV
jgi:hypothetical protein